MSPHELESIRGNELSPHRKELLNHIIDEYARDEPERLYAEIPFSPTTYAAGLRKVTYAAFANAINGMAWWLHHKLGPGKNFETLCYIGPNDLRHNILLLGAVKAGYKVSSPNRT
jgi:acyl-CoA synthetase (AMP-forming)/AMP-acid ligase II